MADGCYMTLFTSLLFLSSLFHTFDYFWLCSAEFEAQFSSGLCSFHTFEQKHEATLTETYLHIMQFSLLFKGQEQYSSIMGLFRAICTY